MRIIKHGKIIIFECKSCGCVWAAARENCRENNPDASVDSAMKIVFYMDCPECGASTAEERDRKDWP